MSEAKLQSDIVRKFSELFPEKRGQLIHVPNERITKYQRLTAKGLGVFNGVSDLVFFDTNIVYCLELKAPGTNHKVLHLQQQVDWGKTMESIGNRWRIITTLEDALKFMGGKEAGLKTEEVQLMLNNTKNKNIKF